MSLEFSLTAVKTTDTNAVLDVLSKFYASYELTLVEERIGNRAGKYANSPRYYTDLKTYAKQELKESGEFNSNFAIAENLSENVGWILIEYSPHYAPLTPNIHTELTRLLSSSLDTIAFEYSEIDTNSSYHFKGLYQGELVDAIETSEGEIHLQRGQFVNLPLCNDDPDLQEPIERKIQECYGFDLNADDMFMEFDMQTRRRFYLKGSSHSIVSYLKNQSAYAVKRPITLSGSMKVMDVMESTKQYLAEQGWIVHIPSKDKQANYETLPKSERAILRSSMIKDHFMKIAYSTCLLVINETINEKVNYIGSSTFLEMGYAFSLNKPIYLLHNIPDQTSTAEIEGMLPIVINGDLSKIK